MKANINALLARLGLIKAMLNKYRTFLIMMIVIGLFGFIFYRIVTYNQVAPSDTAIEEQLSNSQRPKIDKTVVDKLQNLETQNIQVQSLFNQARDNPFKE